MPESLVQAPGGQNDKNRLLEAVAIYAVLCLEKTVQPNRLYQFSPRTRDYPTLVASLAPVGIDRSGGAASPEKRYTQFGPGYALRLTALYEGWNGKTFIRHQQRLQMSNLVGLCTTRRMRTDSIRPSPMRSSENGKGEKSAYRTLVQDARGQNTHTTTGGQVIFAFSGKIFKKNPLPEKRPRHENKTEVGKYFPAQKNKKTMQTCH